MNKLAKSLVIKNLKLISYPDAMQIMDAMHAERVQNLCEDTLLVLEHNPVITKGRRLTDVTIPNEDQIRARGIAICQTDRGGLLTYHAPGQIVVYFILRLTDSFHGISELVAALEVGIQKFLSDLGVQSQIKKDHPGIWVGERKVASLGLRVADGVTKHGIALNVSNDMSAYALFDPCGLAGNTMTSLEEILTRKISDEEKEEWKKKLALIFCNGFCRGAS